MLSLKNSTISLALLSSVLVVGTMSSKAQAQDTTVGGEVTAGMDSDTDFETTAAEDETDTWNDSTDFTGSDWPNSTSSAWIPSGGPMYGYVSCPAFQGSHGHHPFPGSSGPMNHWPPHGAPGNEVLELGYQCHINNHYGLVHYTCQCGEMAQDRQGQLPQDWFFQRPTREAQLAGCQELFEQQCGKVDVKATSACVSDFGRCNTTLVQQDTEGTTSSTLILGCDCVDNSSWGAGEVYPGDLQVNGAVLRDRCEAELALCGIEPVGQGAAETLGLGPALSSMIGCSSAFGECAMYRESDGQQKVECECRSGKGTQAQGDLGWTQTATSELLKVCAQELSMCGPNGAAAPELGAEGVGDSAGAQMPGLANDTGGDQGTADSHTPVQLNCSLSEGSGRGGWALLSLAMLLGLRRRRQV